jgi:pimeloyl-ACP methyl ester carboxylesterase
LKPHLPAIVLLLPLTLAAGACASSGRGGPAAPGSLTGKLTPCSVPGLEEEVFCGRYEVPEDRAAGAGRKIGLNVVVLPAKTAEKEPDPLVFLAGGGVAPATGYAGFLGRALPDLRQHRDVLLVDQRGTGGSNPLDCELSTDADNAEYRDEVRFREAVRRCRREVESKADLHYYTTPIAMDDLDDVRGWLGYPRLNLYGASYGTTAAMVYLRRHRQHVRSVVLQGVLPLDAPMWLESPRSSQLALEHVFATCARQRACHDAFPQLAEEFGTLMRRLVDAPVAVEVAKADGERVKVVIDAEVLRVFVFRLLYSAERIHDLPLLVHLAHGGDYVPLARRLAEKVDSGIPKGIYLSIVCSEEIPKFEAAALPAAVVGTLTELRVSRDLLACGEWVRGWLPPDHWSAVASDVPVLLMTGSLDHVTPPRYAERVARTLSRARQLVLPNRGHNDVDPCVTGLVEAFVGAGSSVGQSVDLTFALRVEELKD